MFDVIIKGGEVIDGTGKGGYRADIGIAGERIGEIGSLKNSSANKTIDAQGLTVCPGFVDLHSHADAVLLEKPTDLPKVMQGVTTEVVGNCGFSLAPINRSRQNMLKQFLEPLLGEINSLCSWTSMDDYLHQLEKRGIGVNVASYVGHQTLRIAVMGFDDQKPTEEEMEKMQHLLAQSLQQGAVGLSTGLIYSPGSYADTRELVRLCEVVTGVGGIYATHIRNESNEILESVKEALDIGRKTGVSVHISHFKICGRENWNRIGTVLNLILQAKKEGLDVTCDMYPYLAGSTTLATLLPPWVHEGGIEALTERLGRHEVRERIKKDFARGIKGWDNIMQGVGWENIFINWVYSRQNKKMEGRNLRGIAASCKKDPAQTLFDLLISEKGRATMVVFCNCEENMRNMMQQPMTMIGTDGIHLGQKPHPRLYGTFPRVLGKYVREEKLLSLEEAIHKMTYLPNQRLGFADRGAIRKGFFADIVVFDPDTIRDCATYKDPKQYSQGIEYVLVSGKVVVEKGEHTGSLPGRVLFRYS